MTRGYLRTDQFMESDKIYDLYKEMNLDCLVSPGFPVPGFQHGLSQKLCYAAMYTFVYNSMDLPTGAFPVTTIKEDEQNYVDTHPNDLMTKVCKEALTDSKGMPLGIQVSTLPF